MTHARRISTAVLATFVAALALAGPSAARTPAQVAVEARLPSWPQATSDVAADPSFRFGVLPNGMRYAIRRQAVPPGQAALRLHISAGSLNEAEGQQGLAHFMEHMAFNGSTRVPEGEMVKILERLGLAFGADTNASTGFEETIYKLDLPKTDRETLDTGLMLLREVAGELTIAPAAVDRERGVILSEERSRDGPALRASRAASDFQFQGQLPPRRFPIGEVAVLKSVDAAGLKAFYQAWYRPGNAVLVAVGDFDPDAVEARIRETFSDWREARPAGPEPELGKVARRGVEARIFVDPGLPAAISVAWASPPDLSPDSEAGRRRDLHRDIILSVLNQRLSDLARNPDPPFIGAASSSSQPFRAQKTSSIYALARGGDWAKALEAILAEQRRIESFGVGKDEVDRVVGDYRASLTANRAGAATQTPAQLAGAITGSITDHDVVTSPEQDLERFERTVKALGLSVLNRTAAELFRGSGPLIFLTSPKAIEGGEATVTEAARRSLKAKVSPGVGGAAAIWPYTTFGTPSGVTERRDAADLDAVFVRFGNGVRLTVKPTKFTEGQILVRVNVGSGRLGLPTDRPSPEWSGGALIEGGPARISARDLDKALTGKVYSAGFGLADDAFVFSGTTRGEDLDTQMQVLAAYVSDPGWRPEAFDRFAAVAASIHDQLASTSGGVLGRDLAALLRGGDVRWAFPSRESLATARLDDLRRAVDPALASGPLEVVVVGDVTVDKAIDAVARTFGALPRRAEPAPIPADRLQVSPPVGGGEAVVRTHGGRADQAILFTAWPTTDFFADPNGARANRLLAEVIGLRLTDELREKQGATYSPSADATQSLVLPGWGYISTYVEIPPDRIGAVTTDIRKIAADLSRQPPTADELARALKPTLESILRGRETNGYWLSALSGVQADPRQLDALRSLIPTLESLTVSDIQAAARKWLPAGRMWRLEVVPESRAARPAT
ncbi:MAG: M16 family metallopeptidase [Phenylobacterium sp.]